jgi:hypothetical protein
VAAAAAVAGAVELGGMELAACGLELPQMDPKLLVLQASPSALLVLLLLLQVCLSNPMVPSQHCLPLKLQNQLGYLLLAVMHWLYLLATYQGQAQRPRWGPAFLLLLLPLSAVSSGVSVTEPAACAAAAALPLSSCQPRGTLAHMCAC